MRKSVLCFTSSHASSLRIEVTFHFVRCEDTQTGDTVSLDAVTLLPNRLFEQDALQIDVETCKQISDTQNRKSLVLSHMLLSPNLQFALEKICIRTMAGLLPVV